MKSVILCVIAIVLYGCKEVPETIENNKVVNGAVIKDSTSPKNDDTAAIDPVYRYVNASSGLNFRDAPDGNILGKFPLNTRVQLLENTGITMELIDAGATIKGTWVKVIVHQSSGYVFSGFLSEDFIETVYQDYMNDLGIMPISSSEIGNRKIPAFISLTDGDWYNRFPKVVAEYQKESTSTNKELYYYLKGKERADFLANRDIKESDNLYIYNFQTDDLTVAVIKEIPLLSHESVYGGMDFLTGLDVKNIIDTSAHTYYSSFAYIGTKNPFTSGAVSAIKWKPIATHKVPKVALNYGTFYNSADYEVLLAYHYAAYGNNYYYSRHSFDNGTFIVDYIFVINEQNTLLYQAQISDSESQSPSIPLTENMQLPQVPEHFTGTLFKDKPAVIFGLYYNSFGCPFIDFISDSELSVYIQCDNRH